MNQQQRISKRTEIENELQERLNYIIEQIKADGNKRETEIHNTIRAAVEDSYQLAIDYVTSKRNVVGFLTSQDLDIIRQQTDDYVIKFNRKVDMVLHRNDVLLQKYNYQPRSPLNSNYMASVLAIGIVTTTMAKATISKIGQIRQSRLKGAAFGFPGLLNIIKDIFTTKSSNPFGVPRDDFEDQVQWNAILDKRVCRACEALNGSYWNYYDAMKPTPGEEFDMHDNCRCMWNYLPSILDIPMAIQLAKLARQGEFAVQDELGLGTVGTKK